MLNHPYIILVPAGDTTGCYGHVRQGHGKAARRQPIFCHRVNVRLTYGNLPIVLRELADLIELDLGREESELA